MPFGIELNLFKPFKAAEDLRTRAETHRQQLLAKAWDAISVAWDMPGVWNKQAQVLNRALLERQIAVRLQQLEDQGAVTAEFPITAYDVQQAVETILASYPEGETEAGKLESDGQLLSALMQYRQTLH